MLTGFYLIFLEINAFFGLKVAYIWSFVVKYVLKCGVTFDYEYLFFVDTEGVTVMQYVLKCGVTSAQILFK